MKKSKVISQKNKIKNFTRGFSDFIYFLNSAYANDINTANKIPCAICKYFIFHVYKNFNLNSEKKLSF